MSLSQFRKENPGLFSALAVGGAFVGGILLYRRFANATEGRSLLATPHSTSPDRHQSNIPMNEWSNAQVLAWLEHQGVSGEAVAKFRHHNIDGGMLARLQEDHLRSIGVQKLGDVVRIVESRDALFGGGAQRMPSPLATSPARQHSEGPLSARQAAPASREPSATATASAHPSEEAAAPPAAAQQGANTEAKQLHQKIQVLYEMFVSDEFPALPIEEQFRRTAAAETELREMLGQIDRLPPKFQQSALEMISSLAELIGKIKESLVKKGEQLQREDAARRMIATLKQIHAVLQSPKTLAAPNDERVAVVTDIINQLQKIKSLAAQLTEAHQQQIVPLTDALLQFAETVRQGPTAEPQQAQPQPAPQAPSRSPQRSPQKSPAKKDQQHTAHQLKEGASTAATAQQALPKHAAVDHLLNRVRSVFEIVKSPAVLQEANLKQRKAMLENAAREIQALEEEGDRLSDPQQKAMIKSATGSVNQILDKLLQVTAHEEAIKEHERDQRALEEQQKTMLKQAREQAAIGQRPKVSPRVPPATGDNDDDTQQQQQQPSRAALIIGASIKKILDTLKSDGFIGLPAEGRKEALSHIQSKLDEMASVVPKTIPSQQEQEHLLRTISQVREFTEQVATMLPGAPEASSSSPTSTSTGAQPSQDHSRLYAKICEQVKRMTNIVRSDEFRQAAPPQREPICRTIIKQVDDLSRNALPRLSTEQQEHLTPIFASMRSIAENALSRPAPQAPPPAEAEQPRKEQEEGEEGEDDGQEDGSPEAFEIVNRLQKLFAVVNSDAFLTCEEGQRLALVSQISQQLVALNARTENLPENEQTTIMPLIQSLSTMLTKLTDAVAQVKSAQAEVEAAKHRERGQGGGEEKEGDGDDEEDDEDDEEAERQRMVIFGTAKRATAVLRMKGTNIQHETLEKFVSLLNDLDRLGVRSEEEINVRMAFHAALQERISSASSRVEEVDGDDEEAADEGDESAKGDEEEQGEGAAASSAPILRRLLSELKNADIKNEFEIIPFMQVLQDIVERDQGNWQRDPDTADLLTEITSLINEKRAGANKTEGGSEGPSQVETMLLDAAQHVSEGVVRREEDLEPMIELLDECKSMQGNFTEPELRAMHTLQTAVLHAARALHDKLAKQDEDEDDDNQQEEVGANNDDEQLKAKKSSKDEGIATTAAETDRLLELLKKMNVKLVDQEASSIDDLKRFITVLSFVKEKAAALKEPSKALDEACVDCETLLKSEIARIGQQASMPSTSAKRRDIQTLLSVLKDPMFPQLQKSQQDNVIRQATALLTSLSPDESAALESELTELRDVLKAVENGDEDDNELVPQSVAADVGLLPRIVERLKEKDFVEQCSLFEIKSISEVLSRISRSSIARRSEQVRDIAAMAHRLFNERLRTSNLTETKDIASVSTALQVNRSVSETETGRSVVSYLLHSPEEEDFEPNAELEEMLVANAPKPVTAATAEEKQSWDNSWAIIIGVNKLPNCAENSTSLSELESLAQLLSEKYGFDIGALVSHVTKDTVKSLLDEVAAKSPSRLLIYVQTPTVNAGSRQEHAAALEDGSIFSHEEIVLAVAGACPNTLLVHDFGHGVDVLASREGGLSPHVTASVSEAAYLVSNTSRCWLFDGLVTPMLLEQLMMASTPLCAEDLVNQLLRTLTLRPHLANGSFIGDKRLGVSFLECDNNDDGNDDE